MRVKINFWSFVFSLICIILFFLSTWSKSVVDFLTNLMYVHPLKIVLVLTFITFLFSIIGLSEAKNSRLLIRSFITIFITIVVMGVTIFIVLLSNLFQFT